MGKGKSRAKRVWDGRVLKHFFSEIPLIEATVIMQGWVPPQEDCGHK